MTNKRRPPKRATSVAGDRPIDRLQPADRERIRASVAAFLAYVRRRRAEIAGVAVLAMAIYLPIAASPAPEFSSVPARPTPTPTAIVRPPV